ncbi:aspartyl protease family protein [Candidatus Woesearchaeota archaeon]|nr:aspartyl protease family protein [Candidatus Woesearchaeota archaeon]
MSLIYRFKKEMLLDGSYVARPRIDVVLRGVISIEVPALIDSGCDVTVIPEKIARALGLEFAGNTTTLYGYREESKVVKSTATITFLGRREISNVTVPVLVALSTSESDDQDIILGVHGIFDAFDITFRKSHNKIVLQKVP